MEIHIRSMRPEDYPAFDSFMARLHRLHQEARPDLFRPAEHPFSREFFEKQLESPNVNLLLAEIEGRPAGMCVFELDENPLDPLLTSMKRAYINDIVVAEEYRRLGVGTALYRETERIAKSCGAKQIFLTVWAFNEAAQRFYEKLGMSLRAYTMEQNL